MPNYLHSLTDHTGLFSEDGLILSENQFCQTVIESPKDGFFELSFTYSHQDWDQWIKLELEYENGEKLNYMPAFPALCKSVSVIVKLCKGKNILTLTHVFGHELIIKAIELSSEVTNIATEITPKTEYIFKNELHPVRIFLKCYDKFPVAVYNGDKKLSFRYEQCQFGSDYSGEALIRGYLYIPEDEIKQLSCKAYELIIHMNDGETVPFTLAVREHDTEHPFKIISLDVGHGNATLLCLPNGKNLLIDSGYVSNSRETVFGYIEKHNIAIDYYLLTHFHSDHNGMLDEILDRFSISVPDQKTASQSLKLEFSKRAEYLSHFQYLDSTMLCRYDDLNQIWDLGDVTITALNSRFEQDGTPSEIWNNPQIAYNEHNYENATSVSLLVRYHGFGYYHGADNYAYTQAKNLNDFTEKGCENQLQCQYFYANHHFHCDVNPEFIRFVNPVAIYIPANQAVYARSAYCSDYLKGVKESVYPQKRLADTFISHESGTVSVHVKDSNDWYYYTMI